VEDIDYRAVRGLDKTVVRALAKDSAWVRNHENIFVLGPTGVGKSFIASALAQKACRDGHSALSASCRLASGVGLSPSGWQLA
jgi:DNA replication protein DnaC